MALKNLFRGKFLVKIKKKQLGGLKVKFFGLQPYSGFKHHGGFFVEPKCAQDAAEDR